MDIQERFWNATIEELVNGYVFDESKEEYICLLCNQRYEDGIIYPMDSMLFTAKKAVIYHIENSHTSVFDHLIHLDKKYTGLTEHQKELLLYFKQGLADKEIVKEYGGSPSTIRNHRFKLKEKEKQAKIFLAIMNLLNKEQRKEQKFVSFHKGAKMVDERYAITEEEKNRVLETYFKDGKLETFPSKEKRKIIVLQSIVTHFEKNKMYTEKEINEVLKLIYSDFVTIRRYLIEYGFMKRNKECTEYWVND